MAIAKNRGRGRPRKNESSASISGRVSESLKRVVYDLAELRRRTTSVEIGIAVENMLLDSEQELRGAGLWDKTLESLKSKRRPG